MRKLTKMWNVIFLHVISRLDLSCFEEMLVIFTFFQCWLRSEKWQTHISSCPPYIILKLDLSCYTGFEKIDRNVKCHFVIFTYFNMLVKVLKNDRLICLCMVHYLCQDYTLVPISVWGNWQKCEMSFFVVIFTFFHKVLLSFSPSFNNRNGKWLRSEKWQTHIST